MEESKRIKEERDKDGRDEALNPTPEAEETGRDNEVKKKAVRNPSTYDEFDSKKAGPGGYEEQEYMPLTDRKKRKDKEIREEELKKAEKEKKAKQKQKEERQKDWEK